MGGASMNGPQPEPGRSRRGNASAPDHDAERAARVRAGDAPALDGPALDNQPGDLAVDDVRIDQDDRPARRTGGDGRYGANAAPGPARDADRGRARVGEAGAGPTAGRPA